MIKYFRVYFLYFIFSLIGVTTVVAEIGINPILVADTTVTICSGTSFTITPAYVNGTDSVPLGTTYTWTALLTSGSIAGFCNKSTGQSSISETLTNSGNTPGTVTYTVMPISPSGVSTEATFTITVTVNPKPAIACKAVMICSGTSFSIKPENGTDIVPLGTTYTWTALLKSGTITGFSNKSTDQDSISETLTNSGDSAGTVLYMVTPKSPSGYCAGAVFTIRVTVNPKPAIADTAATICSGTAFFISPVNGTDIVPLGTTYTWTALTSDSIGGFCDCNRSSDHCCINETLYNNENTVGTATYTVTPKLSSGLCTGPTFAIIVTVIPKPVISCKAITICSGTSFSIKPENGADIIPLGTTYTWTTLLKSGTITGFSNKSTGQDSISETLTNSGDSAGTVIYTVTPKSPSGYCAGSVFTIRVTVNPKPAIADTTATICSGTAFTITPVNGTDIVPLGTTYTWTALLTSGNIGGFCDCNRSSDHSCISDTLFNNGNTVGTVKYTVTPKLSSGRCTGPTFTIIVTVNPVPVIADTTVMICSGTSFSVTPENGADNVPSGTTYTWSNPVLSPSSSISGGNMQSAQLAIVQTLSNTTLAPATATYTVKPLTGSCMGSNFTLIATVNPKVNLTSTLTPSAICNNTTFSYIPASDATGGTVNYTWSRATIAGISNAAATGAGAISETLTNTGIVPISVNYIYNLSLNGCTNNSNYNAVVTVYPTVSNADAGNDIGPLIATSITLNGKQPVTGIGSWSQASGPNTAVITQPLVFNTTVLSLIPGTYQFVWTITSPWSCSISRDTVIVILLTPPYVDLDIKKTIITPNTNVAISKDIQFKIELTNIGTKMATGVIVSDALALNLGGTNVELKPSKGTAVYDPVAKVILWQLDSLAIGQIEVLLITAQIIDRGNIDNTSTAKSNDVDHDESNNTSSVSMIVDEPADLFIPNVITPNGDGKNDRFVILGLSHYPNSELMIFNRWDNMVYHSTNYNNEWDGNGLNQGTYYYIIKLKKETGNEVKRGWILLQK